MIKYCGEYWRDLENTVGCIPNIEKLNNKAVLITGATGLICSSVTDLLLFLNKYYSANITIYIAGRNLSRAEKRFANYQEGKDYHFVKYDAVKDAVDVCVDYVIHGASNASPALFVQQPVETMMANIVGLYSLMSSVKAKGARLLYISSSEVYGNKDNQDPYREGDYGYIDILNPRACYPLAKRASETLCIACMEEYNIDTVIVRPGHIYGPSIAATDNRASAEFTRNAIKGEDITMKSLGNQLRSYCYELDCASAILTVLINGESGNAYNISNNKSIVTIAQMADAFASAAGKQVVYELPTDLERKGYNMMTNSSLCSEKLEQLGWKAQYNITEGTAKTLRLYLPN